MATNKPTTLLVTPFLTLLSRELGRFLRYPARVWGFVIAPLLIALVASAGIGEGVLIAALPEGVGAAYFFYPSLIVLCVIFTAINVPGSIIEDRRDGFMQAVLVSPISYSSVVFAKVAAGGLISLAQALLLVAFAPLIGLRLSFAGAMSLIAVLAVIGISFASLGFVIAWLADSAISFYWIISAIILPLWVLGGGLAPFSPQSWLAFLAPFNLVGFALNLSRMAFSLPGAGGHRPDAALAIFAEPDFLHSLIFASGFLLVGFLLLHFRVRTAI